MNDEVIDFGIPQPYVSALLRHARGGSVLDIGSGWGRNACFFADHGFAVTAVDDDPNAIAALEQYNESAAHPIAAVHQDLRDFRPKEQYDLVLCTMALHYLGSRKEVVRVIRRLQRATRPGGINVVSLYTDRNVSGLRPYLAPVGTLPGLYRRWAISGHYEGLGRSIPPKRRTKPTRHWVERVTARKSLRRPGWPWIATLARRR